MKERLGAWASLLSKAAETAAFHHGEPRSIIAKGHLVIGGGK